MISISAEKWIEGIGNNQYVGLANIHNLRIDDIGTLRLHPKPTKVVDSPGDVIRVEKGYFDTQENWFATVGQVVRTAENVDELDIGGSAIYQSLGGSYLTLDKALSGSVVWRDYMFTFNRQPGIESDLLVDTDSDGRFDLILNDWEILTTEGQTQARFDSITPELNISNDGAVILDTSHIVAIVGTDLRVYEIVGSTFVQKASFTTNADSIAGFDGNNFATMETDTGEIKRWNWDGVDTITLVHTQFVIPTDTTYVSMSRMDANNVCAVYHNGESLSAPQWLATRSYSIGDTAGFEGNIYVAEDDIEGDINNENPSIDTSNWDLVTFPDFNLRFSSFEWNGSGFSESVISVNDSDDLFDPFIVGLTANRAVVLVSSFGSPTLVSYERSVNWSETARTNLASIGISINEIGPLAKIDSNDFVMVGNTRASFKYDDLANEISILNDNITGFLGARQTADQLNGQFIFTEILGVQLFSYNEGVIDSTPAIVGLDDGVYWANGNNIASLIETPGTTFDPNDPGTYNINHSALDLPERTVITSISEVGQFIAIGTLGGLIYYWDRVSDSFRIPVIIGEKIAILNSKNNVVYCVSNDAGNVYLADFSSYQKAKSLSSLTPIRFRNDFKTNATEIFDDGFYVGGAIADNNTQYTGIWVYRNGAWTIITPTISEQVQSLGKVSPSQMVIGLGSQIEIVDLGGSVSARWDGDEAYLTDQMRVIGEVARKSQQLKYSVYFEKQMEETDYFAIQYRTTTNAQFTEINRVTGAEMGTQLENGLYAYTNSFSVPSTEQIQTRLILNTVAGFVKLDII